MKKTLLSAAAFAVVAVSAVSIAPTTSEAIPAFARQTGAACLSCHFQTFPALNDFGRAFKLGAFTDVGEQALIEDDNFSLPAVLNLGMVLRPQYFNTKDTTGAVTTTWVVPGDSNILLAGRVGSNTGAFVEFANGAGNFQLMNSIDFDTFKAGLNIAATSFGPTAALEFTSVYGQHGGKLWGSDVSAINNTIAAVGTTAIAAWASNDTFTVQVAAVVPNANLSGNATINNANFIPMIAATYAGDLGGFDTVVEVGTMNGTATNGGAAAFFDTTLNNAGTAAVGVTAATGPQTIGVKASWIAAQIQGEIGDASLGIYGDFVTTKSNGTNGNLYANTAIANAKVDGYSIRAEIEPIHQLMFGLGYGTLKEALNTTSLKTTYTHYAVTYEIYQNMEVTLSKTDTNVTGSTAAIVAANGPVNGRTKSTLVELEAVF